MGLRTTGTLAVVVLASGVMLAGCGGKSDTEKAAEQVNAAASGAAAAASSAADQIQAAASGAVSAAQSAADAAVQSAGDPAAGKAVFSTNCAGCHTLADAGATGALGPNLDELKPDATRVLKQVTAGGGGMPAFGGSLSAADIANVAAYVSSVAGA